MNTEKIEQINNTLKRIEHLQKELSACEDDNKAIDIQEELMNILSDIFEDNDFLHVISGSLDEFNNLK